MKKLLIEIEFQPTSSKSDYYNKPTKNKLKIKKV